MKKILYILGVMVAVASCAKDDTETLVGSDVVAFSTEAITSRVETVVTASPTSTTLTSSWEAGDAVGISSNSTSENYKYIAEGSGDQTSFTPASSDSQFLVSRDASPTDITYSAYYPYQEGDYYISDVTDQSDLGAIDLLVASPTQTTSTSTSSVVFAFTHKLAMVSFVIDHNESVETLQGAKVVLTSNYERCEYNFDGTFIANSNANYTNGSGITLDTTYDATSGKLIATGIVNVPGAADACVLSVTDSEGALFESSFAPTFVSASIHNYTLTVGVDEIDFIEGDITSWGTEDKGDWTADTYDMKLVDGVYEIYSAAGLKAFADLVNGGSNTINGKLMKSVDISGNSDWTPIGDNTNRFKGNFDGNGKRVSGLYIDNDSNSQGLFGYTYGATISNVNVIGDVSGDRDIGGIVGYNQASTIINCSYSGKVSGSSFSVGGIAGYNENASIIVNCYNLAEVSGSSYVGGVVGYNIGSSVKVCYNAGAVTGTSTYIGAVVGINDSGTIADCYYDSTINSEVTFDNTDGTAKTTAEMKSSDLLTLLNDAAVLYNSEETPEIEACEWITGLDGYPTLNFGVKPTYSKDIEFVNNVYQIYSGDGLREFATKANSVDRSISGKLMCNIDLGGIDENGNGIEGKEFTPICSTDSNSSAYSGKFDGGGYCISGLYINNPDDDYQGLFGYIFYSEIKNLGVDGIVNGKSYVGGIAGYAYSDSNITDCYNLAAVQGENNYIGGIVGYAKGISTSSTMEVTGCYNKGSVKCSTCSSVNYVGGIIGRVFQHISLISNCYNRGVVYNGSTNANANTSGIVGHYSIYVDGWEISNCYNAGSISAAGSYAPISGVGEIYIDYNYAPTATLAKSLINCYNDSSCTNYCYIDGSNYNKTGNMTEAEMTDGTFATTLGSYWKEDTENINDGYPVLSWQ